MPLPPPFMTADELLHGADRARGRQFSGDRVAPPRNAASAAQNAVVLPLNGA